MKTHSQGYKTVLENIKHTNSKHTHFPLNKNPLTIFWQIIPLPPCIVLLFEYPLPIPTPNPKLSREDNYTWVKVERRLYENLIKRLILA